MRKRVRGCALWALAFALVFASGIGCDKDADTSSGSTGGGGGTAASSDAPAAAADPGKPVAKTDQLLGSWFRQGVLEDPIGLEFSSDGKVMVYGQGGGGARVGAVTLSYTMLEGGGRLRPRAAGLGGTFHHRHDQHQRQRADAEGRSRQRDD